MGVVSSKLRNSAKGQQKPADRRFIDMTGQRFGRLTIVSYAGRPRPSKHMWNCICDCGSEASIDGMAIRKGKASSCGCYRRELNATRFVTHGLTKTTEYNSWMGMKDRCLNPSNAKYPRYGGRGISICDRWLKDFANFAADMGLKPSPEHSIDRINNDGNYEPSNCRWATPLEQQRNRGGQRVWKGLE